MATQADTVRTLRAAHALADFVKDMINPEVYEVMSGRYGPNAITTNDVNAYVAAVAEIAQLIENGDNYTARTTWNQVAHTAENMLHRTKSYDRDVPAYMIWTTLLITNATIANLGNPDAVAVRAGGHLALLIYIGAVNGMLDKDALCDLYGITELEWPVVVTLVADGHAFVQACEEAQLVTTGRH